MHPFYLNLVKLLEDCSFLNGHYESSNVLETPTWKPLHSSPWRFWKVHKTEVITCHTQSSCHFACRVMPSQTLRIPILSLSHVLLCNLLMFLLRPLNCFMNLTKCYLKISNIYIAISHLLSSNGSFHVDECNVLLHVISTNERYFCHSDY